MNEIEQMRKKKENGFSDVEILQDFLDSVDDYDGIVIVGKRKDGEIITSWSADEGTSAIGMMELSKYIMIENREV